MVVYFKGSIVGPWPAVIQRAKVFQPPPDSSSSLSLSSFFLFSHLPSPLAKMFIPSPPTKSFSQKLFSPRYSLASSLHPRFTPVIADPVTRPSLPQCLLPCTDCTCSLFLVTNIIVTISTSTSAYQPPSYPYSVHATCYQQPLLPFILYFGKSLSTSMTFVCFSLTVHMCVCV